MLHASTASRLAATFAAACSAVAGPLAAAQPDPAKDYPSKPVRFIVPFAPGAGTDTTARTIALKLSEIWGQQVVADNRTGAAGAIGVDLTAKANPGKLYFGSSGTGGLQHFAGEMFNHMAGTRMTHVPYKGTAAVIPAMLAGDVQVGFGTLFGVRPHLPSGRLRALAVTTGKRTPAAPELPTVAEAGVPGYEVDQWYGVLTSAKVPMPIVRKISAGINEALRAPEVVKRFTADGSTPFGSTPEQFGKHISSEIAKWRKLSKEAGLKLGAITGARRRIS